MPKYETIYQTLQGVVFGQFWLILAQIWDKSNSRLVQAPPAHSAWHFSCHSGVNSQFILIVNTPHIVKPLGMIGSKYIIHILAFCRLICINLHNNEPIPKCHLVIRKGQTPLIQNNIGFIWLKTNVKQYQEYLSNHRGPP